MAMQTQNLKLSDYATDFDVSMNWWRCYRFTLSESITVTGLIGGGTDVFYGAIFDCDENNTPLNILTSVIFSGSNPDQIITLDTSIELQSGTNYLIGQARKNSTGYHYIITDLNKNQLLSSHPITTWYPETFNAIRFNDDGSPENILNQDYYDLHGVMPRIGLQYEIEVEITTSAPPPVPQFPNYIINNSPASLHQIINYIVDYICNVEIESNNCFNINGSGYDIKTIINNIISYLCDINILPNYINIPYEVRDLHGILKYIVDYLCRINLDVTCLNISSTNTLNQILNSINTYLCEIQLEYNCLFDEATSLNLHTILNKLCYSLCNINFEENCFNISSPNNLHNILNGICRYLCNISLKYNCINEYAQIYDLSVSVIGQGQVDSNPIGVSCPSDCYQQFIYGTGVELEAIPDIGWKFDKWKGPFVEQQTFQSSPINNLYDTLNKILNYLCSIYICPNCFAEDQTYSLHGILDQLSQYVCHINLNYNCMDMRNYDNLHNTLNGILKYICNVKLDVDCFSNSGEGTNLQYFECDTSDVFSSMYYVLYQIVDYLCNISLDYDCWNVPNPSSLHNILNAIIDYLCTILVGDNCITDSDVVTLHEFFIALDKYLCFIPVEHCFDESFPTTTPSPTMITTTSTTTTSSTTTSSTTTSPTLTLTTSTTSSPSTQNTLYELII